MVRWRSKFPELPHFGDQFEMRSRAARLTCSAAAWIALAAAALFVVQSEKQIAARADGVRAFDQHAREAAGSLGDVRAAQQAYVAAGQDNAFWMPKVASMADRVRAAVSGLRDAATDATARAALDQAANTIAMFGDIDKRAREYLKSNQPLMAADVIFTEGGEAAATAARSVEAARLAERRAADAADAAKRGREAMAIGGAAALAAVIVLLLVPAGMQFRWQADTTYETTGGRSDVTYAMNNGRRADGSYGASGGGNAEKLVDVDEWASPAHPAHLTVSAPSDHVDAPGTLAPGTLAPGTLAPSTQHPAPSTPMSHPATMIKAAADLATDFGRVRDLDDLARILARTAEALEATGLVVWMGTLTGDDLRPFLAHGYSEQTLARIAPVSRTDDNAAAAAYRSGQLQIVVSKPGASGAIVAPILVPGGCIGALSAEFLGGETSESVQSFATIVAAHLATVLPTAPAESIEQKAAGVAHL
jgi:hypothetical protein